VVGKASITISMVDISTMKQFRQKYSGRKLKKDKYYEYKEERSSNFNTKIKYLPIIVRTRSEEVDLTIFMDKQPASVTDFGKGEGGPRGWPSII
jgi:hypothetical protein